MNNLAKVLLDNYRTRLGDSVAYVAAKEADLKDLDLTGAMRAIKDLDGSGRVLFAKQIGVEVDEIETFLRIYWKLNGIGG